MTAKEYLKQAYRLNELINSDLEELNRLRQLSTSIASPNLSGDAVAGSRPQDARFTNIVLKITELEEKINDEVDRYVDLQDKIRSVINTIPDLDQRLLLRLRYIEFLTLEQISEKMSYSVMQINRLHAKALKNIKIPET